MSIFRLKTGFSRRYDIGMDKPIVEIISVAFERLGELKVFVQCILNQRQDNWKLRVINDGPYALFCSFLQGYALQKPGQMFYE